MAGIKGANSSDLLDLETDDLAVHVVWEKLK